MVLTMGTKQQTANSNREYSEHVFTIAMNIFAMANGFVLYVIMKVEIHSHVVIRFSSKTRAHDHFCFILIDIVIYIYDIDKKTNHSNLWNSTLYLIYIC